jgi:hypothetical protein
MRAVATLLLVLTGAASTLADETQEPPELVDQLGRADGLRAHRGRVVVGLVADLRALRHLKAWEVELRDRLGDAAEEIRFLRVADAPPDRGVTRERVLDKLDGRVPDEVSILVDLEGTWRQTYALETRRPNVLLFDVDGRLRRTVRGTVDPEIAERVAAWALELLPAR